MKIRLERVRYMPKQILSNVLYVSEEFGTAAHLCACGCGKKVRTPLGPAEWSLEETSAGPTLRPSIGNWQLPCRSHYWIRRGQIVWADRWSAEEIVEGRRREEERRFSHYDEIGRKRSGALARLWQWIRSQLGRNE
jgi:hypothetical protein